MIGVKICGLNEPAAFDAAIESRADWVGFVFFPPSPRYLTPRQAYQLSSRAPSNPPRVGLFVRPTLEEISRTLEEVHLDVIQLYGVEDFTAMREKFGGEIWRAVGVESGLDLPMVVENEVDRLVVEAKPPAGATRPGGNAATFEWQITKDWSPPSPWILAGGLDIGNVGEAIALSGATAVDVSSGVETSVGVKSPKLIRAFILSAKGTGSA